MKAHILGFPRIGANRELKRAVEAFWKGKITQEELTATADELKQRHWAIQGDQGLSYVTVGDFSYYDHVLDTIAMLGMIPERFEFSDASIDLNTYFRMARGDAAANLHAMEMTKWFDANYHYIVPEFSRTTTVRLASTKLLDETSQAIALGYSVKPVLVGPITLLALGKEMDDSSRWDHLDAILDVYAAVLAELAELCDWIQIDEPILCGDLSEQAAAAFPVAYEKLNQAVAGKAQLMLATYFDTLGENMDLTLSLGTGGLHVDLVRGRNQLEELLGKLPESMTLSAGVVDGRNVWKNDIVQTLDLLRPILASVDDERLMVASSSSLLHSPVDLDQETELAAEIRDWMAFAVQKCGEVSLIRDALEGTGSGTIDQNVADRLEANRQAIDRRRDSPLCTSQAVRERVGAVNDRMLSRNRPYEDRKKVQQEWLKLPLFPTTTIGSFPQTPSIRQTRLAFKRGEISQEEYELFIKAEIQSVVNEQEELDIDVLVHGEPERNDMVEYFGQQLDGFCFTQYGWVQSYGSRCVKPPIIYGDVSRPKPMTVEWMKYAQSITDRPMKGMLTGPVTILCWSFVRDDLPRKEVCRQIALAIRDEVRDLEKAGIAMIQIDEAALREGMPLKSRDADTYLRWAVDSFLLATSGVEDRTQIHTHMCYSEFNTIVQWIAAMDADVISVEASRSNMELLDAFEQYEYPNEIGPGVYDIHSPRVPTVTEMVDLLYKALQVIPVRRLWVNPDCGLKTRQWPESRNSLRNMVEAAKKLRAAYAKK